VKYAGETPDKILVIEILRSPEKYHVLKSEYTLVDRFLINYQKGQIYYDSNRFLLESSENKTKITVNPNRSDKTQYKIDSSLDSLFHEGISGYHGYDQENDVTIYHEVVVLGANYYSGADKILSFCLHHFR
jgi:hypothetical protein